MIDDVDQLVGDQVGVQRVQDRAHGHHPEHRFQVLGDIRHHGRDPVADADPGEVVQGMRQGSGTGSDLGEGGVLGVVTVVGADTGVAVHAASVLQDLRQQQRVLAHRRGAQWRSGVGGGGRGGEAGGAVHGYPG